MSIRGRRYHEYTLFPLPLPSALRVRKNAAPLGCGCGRCIAHSGGSSAALPAAAVAGLLLSFFRERHIFLAL